MFIRGETRHAGARTERYTVGRSSQEQISRPGSPSASAVPFLRYCTGSCTVGMIGVGSCFFPLQLKLCSAQPCPPLSCPAPGIYFFPSKPFLTTRRYSIETQRERKVGKG